MLWRGLESTVPTSQVIALLLHPAASRGEKVGRCTLHQGIVRKKKMMISVLQQGINLKKACPILLGPDTIPLHLHCIGK